LRLAGIPLVVIGLLAGTAVSGHAFTLVDPGKPYVYATPSSGLPTATFKVRGTYAWINGCPVSAPVSLIFKFYWYKVTTNKVLLWTKSTNVCSASVTNTGWSGSLLPPPGLNYPASFVIQVMVYSSNGAPFGKGYTNTILYVVQRPPPSPSPKPSPSPQCGQPGALPCPSPSPTPCTAQQAALSPGAPGGSDAAVVVALALLGTLPISGVAMVLSPGLWKRRRSWSRLAALIGLSVLLLSAEACAALTSQNPQATPTQPEQSPSPTPSC